MDNQKEKRIISQYMRKGWVAYVRGYKTYTENYEDTFGDRDHKLGCKVCNRITCICEGEDKGNTKKAAEK